MSELVADNITKLDIQASRIKLNASQELRSNMSLNQTQVAETIVEPLKSAEVTGFERLIDESSKKLFRDFYIPFKNHGYFRKRQSVRVPNEPKRSSLRKSFVIDDTASVLVEKTIFLSLLTFKDEKFEAYFKVHRSVYFHR